MAKKCDHTSVGMLVHRGDTFRLIERMNPPVGFAPPAGHVDDFGSFEEAARQELKEEVGLDMKGLTLLAEGRRENPCRREDGNWHYWKIYELNADGTVQRSESETKQAHFYTRNDLLSLADKTEKYIRGSISQTDWERSPGLEPVWYEWLKELKIIP